MLEDEAPKTKKTHEIGEDLDSLSVHELNERIELLETEIVRLKEAITRRDATRAAAEDVFKL